MNQSGVLVKPPYLLGLYNIYDTITWAICRLFHRITCKYYTLYDHKWCVCPVPGRISHDSSTCLSSNNRAGQSAPRLRHETCAGIAGRIAGRIAGFLTGPWSRFPGEAGSETTSTSGSESASAMAGMGQDFTSQAQQLPLGFGQGHTQFKCRLHRQKSAFRSNPRQ